MPKSIALIGLWSLVAFVSGCSKPAGEVPSEAEVQAAAHQQFKQQLAGPDISEADRKAYADALAAATFAADPHCVKGGDGAYACVLEMTATMPGDSGPTQQPIMVELVKTDEEWRAAPVH